MQLQPEELVIKAEELKRMADHLLAEADTLMQAYESLSRKSGTPQLEEVKKTGSSQVLKFPR